MNRYPIPVYLAIMLPSSNSNEYTFEFQVPQACAEYLDRQVTDTGSAGKIPKNGRGMKSVM